MAIDISKILKEKLGDTYTAEIDKEIKNALKENQSGYVSKSDYENKMKELAELTSKLKEQDKVHEESMSLQEKYDKLKTESDNNAKNYAKTLNDLRLENELSKIGAKNTKALKALLDNSKLKVDGDNITGLEEQIEALRKSDSYLFQESNDVPTGTGGFGAVTISNQTDNKTTLLNDLSKAMNINTENKGV